MRVLSESSLTTRRYLKWFKTNTYVYSHKYMKLPMVSAEEFLEEHPECAEMEEHELTLARIEDEQAQRAKLEGKRADLVKRKEELVRETTAKKEELGKVDAEVEKWVNGQETARKLFEIREKKVAEAAEKAAAAAGS